MRKLFHDWVAILSCCPDHARRKRLGVRARGKPSPPLPLRSEPDRRPPSRYPTLIDGDLKLWDSAVIIEYLMSSYPSAAPPAGTAGPWRPTLFAPLTPGKTGSFTRRCRPSAPQRRPSRKCNGPGLAMRTIVTAPVARSATSTCLNGSRLALIDSQNGFVHGEVSAQDIFLACWCQFIERRPLRLTWAAPDRPKLTALVARLAARPSFKQEPILWWEPGRPLMPALQKLPGLLKRLLNRGSRLPNGVPHSAGAPSLLPPPASDNRRIFIPDARLANPLGTPSHSRSAPRRSWLQALLAEGPVLNHPSS